MHIPDNVAGPHEQKPADKKLSMPYHEHTLSDPTHFLSDLEVFSSSEICEVSKKLVMELDHSAQSCLPVVPSWELRFTDNSGR